MKKQILALLAAVAFIGVGCERGDEANEPAGAGRDSQMDQSTYGTDTNAVSTNTVSEPSGAQPQSSDASSAGASQSSSSQSGSSQSDTNSTPDQSGSQSQPQGQSNP